MSAYIWVESNVSYKNNASLSAWKLFDSGSSVSSCFKGEFQNEREIKIREDQGTGYFGNGGIS